MEESSATAAANNVAGAIRAALDWSSSPDSRAAAVAYLESVKAGDIRVLANTSFLLVKKDWSSEIRLHALKMLQHLVRLRWEEFGPDERRNFANAAVNLMSEMANPSEEWAMKSQTAALVAEMVRREGVELWKELFPSLVSISNNGSIQAELVTMVLRWLPEDITVHNEDLEGDRRRLLLRGLTESLPEIFPLLYTLLERHFGAALSDTSRQQLDIAKQHAAAVTATLHAIDAYAEWAPLPDLSKFGIVHGCSILLSSPDFRLHACEFFKHVSSRRRPVDASASGYDSAVSNIFQILLNASRECLHKSSSNGGAIEESELEFVESICESLVSLGLSNLHFIASDSTILPEYLHQMLRYFQHYKLAFHYQALLFWMALMRYAVFKPKIIAATVGDSSSVTNNQGLCSGQSDTERRNVLEFINDDLCNVILDISFQRLAKRENVSPGSAIYSGALELWSDDFEDKGDFSQYRSKLLELIRIVAYHKPLLVATRVSDRIISTIQTLLVSLRPFEDLAIVKSMQLALENVVNALFDGPSGFGGGSSEVQLALCKIFEGLLQQLLSLKWTEPDPVDILAHYLEVLGPFLKYFTDGVGPVINKLFELLTSLPHSVKDPSTSKARYARLQICSSFIGIAKTANKSLLPHMKGIADTMAYLQGEGCLPRAEYNLLGEAFLIMASSAGVNQQQEVLAWLLEPLSKEWTQSEWQNSYLSDPTGLVRLCSDRPFMWSLFHTVTFFEKALKRSGVRKGNPFIQNTLAPTTAPSHPLGSHLVWMLPPLLKLLRGIHSLWSPPITQGIPGNLKTSMAMSEVERTSLLGEVIPKSSSSSTYGLSNEGFSEPDETDIRNWLKGIRDSGYNVLGLSATIGDFFFKSLDTQLVTLALVENVQSMEFRHMKQLVHSVLVPIVRCCPCELREERLEKILHPLFLHSEQALRCSWSSLLQEGRSKVPDVHDIMTGSDLKVEVLEEKLLRALTREICSFLSVLSSPALNTSLPSIDQSGISRIDTSSLKDLDSFAPSSMVCFILKHKSLSRPALQICLQALKWTDTESVTKVSSFCGTVVLLAIYSNNVELREFVCKDMFYAIIEGLALESNALISADLVGLCREIFIYLSHRDPIPRQILLSLPCITPHDLAAFEEALTKTSSPKEQKQHMKSLLVLATGNKLKALAAQKSLNVITNVTTIWPKLRKWYTGRDIWFVSENEAYALGTESPMKMKLDTRCAWEYYTHT